MKGLVTKSTGSWYEVLQENGTTISCRLRGQFRIKGIKNTNPVVVGDQVNFIIEKDNTGFIVEIEERKNYIDRKSTKLSKINHLLAANIDTVFLIITLKEPRTSLGFIDRFLVAAEGFRIPVCLIFNKMDLYEEEELKVVEELRNLYRQVGYDSICASIYTGMGMEEIKSAMVGKISLFSGHSGVGKSAIINT
ncbi:MAG: GTPase RsgA, partial [Bacteroidales bacterium]